MPYCHACGVEVDADAIRCPLCEGAVEASPPEALPVWPPDLTADEALGKRGRHFRFVIFEVLTILMVGTLLAIAVIDYARNGGLTWSAFAMPALAAGWCYMGLALYFHRSLVGLVGGVFAVTGSLLALLNAAGGWSWFVPVGLPVVLVLAALTGGIGFLASRLRMSWANLLGMILLGVGAFCLALNVVINVFLEKPESLTWGLPVIGSLIPPALFMFYVHYRLSKEVDLGKLFHL